MLLVALVACGDGRTVNAEDSATPTSDAGAEIRQPECVPEGPPPPGYGAPDAASKVAALAPDVDVIRAYGSTHPDEFTGVASEYTMGQRLLVYFTDHLDEHRAALSELVAKPDDFEVVRSAFSEREAIAIAEEIQNGEPFKGQHGGGGYRSFSGQIGVNFYPTKSGRAAAGAARDRWGDGVCVEIAGHPYPKGSWPDTSHCERAHSFDENRDVSMELELDPATTARGEIVTGTLLVTNNGNATLTWPAGSEIGAQVLERASDDVVGGEWRGVADDESRTAGPGQTVKIPVRFTTGDCRPDSDYALPAGTYDVVTGLSPNGGSARAILRIIDEG